MTKYISIQCTFLYGGNMYNIFICDDDDECLKRIKEKLEYILLKNRIFASIHSYTSAKNMIFDVQGQDLSTAIFFIDIVMPSISGIEAAKIIRKMNIESQIIFLTSSKKYVFEALEIMPLHYLIKQEVNDFKIESVLLKAIKICRNKNNNFFCYKLGHAIKRISVDRISFFEVKNRVVYMYKVDNEVEEFYATMKNLEEAFCRKYFIRIHRSYIVNLQYISSLENHHIILQNLTVLPVGNKYIENVKTMYEKFVLNDIKIF